MKFIDHTKIIVSSGNGGDGMMSFHRARNKPKLGPDGGNGGNGGSVYFTADSHGNTLGALRYKKQYKAEHGRKGGSQNKTGACGKNLEIQVPLGTVLFEEETRQVLGEILNKNDKLLVAKGGKRGYGNLSYVTPTRQAPYHSTQGQKGTTLSIGCELKLLADVGLVGLPNAGKSSFLSTVSSARPKVAAYPFTTLSPKLGVVDYCSPAERCSSFVIADIPGIINGASHGKGLGHQFLKHIERNKILLLMIDIFNDELSPLATVDLLVQEMSNFNATMIKKKMFVVLNKIDLLPENSEELESVKKSLHKCKYPVHLISTQSKQGIQKLLGEIRSALLEIDSSETATP